MTKSTKFITILLVAILLSFNLVSVFARGSDDIGLEIDEKREELEKTNEEIKRLKEEIENNEILVSEAATGLPKLEAEINKINSEIALNDATLKQLEQELELKKLQKSDKEERQEKSLNYTYKNWRLNRNAVSVLTGDSYEDFKYDQYASITLGVSKDDLLELSSEIRALNLETNQYEELIAGLSNQNNDLQSKKRSIENEIAYYSGLINQNLAASNNLLNLQDSLQEEILSLLAEQRDAAAREAELLKNTQNQAPKIPPRADGENNISVDPVAGTFYFSGIGRDTYQGHGVGMSQWGAYGAGNAGMNYEQILRFYYIGIDFGVRGGSVNVTDLGLNLDIEEYVSHLGEVPTKACGNAEQAKKSPNKYVVDDPGNMWDCWPEETIKAQIIAARTYALYHGSVFSDARSQVYNPSFDARWAAKETEGIVITYGGELIEALYSADNSQGNGTANNETIFQSITGDGTIKPYLRAVNDTSFAATTQWTNWNYSTFHYNYDLITEMLEYSTTEASGYSPYERDYIRSILNGASQIRFN
ncbi:MAG: SpoIID/LytB domain-containing protein [Candidatus Dojkabacteria bacterium]|nr:SpoIID/LytB domain-containing protein [Candidatus Dojkabacteria bacterium]